MPFEAPQPPVAGLSLAAAPQPLPDEAAFCAPHPFPDEVASFAPHPLPDGVVSCAPHELVDAVWAPHPSDAPLAVLSPVVCHDPTPPPAEEEPAAFVLPQFPNDADGSVFRLFIDTDVAFVSFHDPQPLDGPLPPPPLPLARLFPYPESRGPPLFDAAN